MTWQLSQLSLLECLSTIISHIELVAYKCISFLNTFPSLENSPVASSAILTISLRVTLSPTINVLLSHLSISNNATTYFATSLLNVKVTGTFPEPGIAADRWEISRNVAALCKYDLMAGEPQKSTKKPLCTEVHSRFVFRSSSWARNLLFAEFACFACLLTRMY